MVRKINSSRFRTFSNYLEISLPNEQDRLEILTIKAKPMRSKGLLDHLYSIVFGGFDDSNNRLFIKVASVF
jgi:hypothetical protein